jgi:hypothetical protein
MKLIQESTIKGEYIGMRPYKEYSDGHIEYTGPLVRNGQSSESAFPQEIIVFFMLFCFFSLLPALLFQVIEMKNKSNDKY